MPPAQYGPASDGLSEQLAQSQVLRRLSTRSSNTSSSSRRGSTRVTKTAGIGNSPHNMQRRRTTATNRTDHYTKSAYGNPYLTREQRLWNYHQARQSPADVRPFSWHPGYQAPTGHCKSIPRGEVAMGNTIAGLEGLAMNNTPSSVQASIQNAFAMGYGFHMGVPDSQAGHQPGQYLTSNRISQDITSSPFNPDTHQDQPYAGSQWQQSCYENPYYDSSTLTAGYATTQQPSLAAPDGLQDQREPEPVEDGGEELVGIGLYDKEDPSPTSLNPNAFERLVQTQVGKDLKLEETWQPPEDTEEDEDSSEEAEEADEAEGIDEWSIPANTASEPQTAFYPPYGDLSNQSFFFNDDDDTYANDDQYTNYLALNSNGFEAFGQAKSQPAGSGNILWF